MEERYVQIRFRETVNINGNNIEYSDALYYPIDNVPKQDVIDATKKERVDNWTEIVKNPPPPVEPTKEMLIAEQVALDEQIASYMARKQEIADKVATMEIDK